MAHLCHIMPEGRPIFLVDGDEGKPAPGAATHTGGGPPSPASAGFLLSVLQSDGTVAEVPGGAAAAAAVLAGQLECAVTGRGFDR